MSLFFGVKSNARYLLYYGVTFEDNGNENTIRFYYPKDFEAEHKYELLCMNLSSEGFINLMGRLRSYVNQVSGELSSTEVKPGRKP